MFLQVMRPSPHESLTVDVDDDDELEEGDDGEGEEQHVPVHERHHVDPALQHDTRA